MRALSRRSSRAWATSSVAPPAQRHTSTGRPGRHHGAVRQVPGRAVDADPHARVATPPPTPRSRRRHDAGTTSSAEAARRSSSAEVPSTRTVGTGAGDHRRGSRPRRRRPRPASPASPAPGSPGAAGPPWPRAACRAACVSAATSSAARPALCAASACGTCAGSSPRATEVDTGVGGTNASSRTCGVDRQPHRGEPVVTGECDREPAEDRGSDVVGMALDPGRLLEELLVAALRTRRQGPRQGEPPDDGGGRRAEPPAVRHGVVAGQAQPRDASAHGLETGDQGPDDEVGGVVGARRPAPPPPPPPRSRAPLRWAAPRR